MTIPRWTAQGTVLMHEQDAEGDWVLYVDHVAELERLKEASSES